ncbi:MAG: hypothetical protein NC301_02485 [Bacteroides sp.]|nr:hypothetical protein [Bacteroides sp.]MCM1379599.1 hypothetical protein [Bacteroides sp.]MCM1446019.1 hypothetical protein [Prevotella sp.]
MSDKEFKSYRFASAEDPTDEMLDRLMAMAAKRVREKNRETKERYFTELSNKCRGIKKNQGL